MISIGKLSSLRRETRLRKIASILGDYELRLRESRQVDVEFLAALARLLLSDELLPRRIGLALAESAPGAGLLRGCWAARSGLLAVLGAEPAEWDLLAPETGALETRLRTVYPARVYLDDLRSPFNVGSIFRSAEAFGVERILLSESTPLPTHPRARRAAMGCAEAVPWEVAGPLALRDEPRLFALETGGTAIERFAFPSEGILVVGSEELGVSPLLLDYAERRLGRVSIPLLGAKRSLNVASAFGIVMHAWASALSRGGSAGAAGPIH